MFDLNPILPIVVSPSNEGWTYLYSENEKENKSLSLLGDKVKSGSDVLRETARQFEAQTEGVFSTLQPRFIDSYRFPISHATLNNIDLTKTITFRTELGDVNTHIAKVYSGPRLGQRTSDRFIRSYREKVAQSEDNNHSDMFRVNVSDIKYLATSPGQSSAMVRIYGEDLDDMREEGMRSLSPLARRILSNEDVLMALSDAVDELRRVNICAPER